MKKVLSVVFCGFIFTAAFAQNVPENRDFLKNDDMSFGGGLHSSGWNIFLERGYIKDAYHRNYWQVEYTQMHNPLEHRQTVDPGFQLTSPPKPFIYGKQNSFLLLNGYVGRQRLIGNKADKSGVLISAKYQGGVSLGFLKPYYLDLLYSIDNNGNFVDRVEKYSTGNADKFLDWNSIYGGGGFAKGLTELRFVPGLAAKLSINFDWATYDDFVKAVEAGVMVQAFYKKVPIMVTSNNRMIYPNLFLHIQFGKRW